LIGTAPAAKAPAKPAAKAPAKPAAKAPAKPAAKAPAKTSKHGSGKFYFPVGSPEREKVKKGILGKLKDPTSTTDIAEKLGVPTWQVRLAAVELQDEKVVKLKKEGNTLTVSRK